MRACAKLWLLLALVLALLVPTGGRPSAHAWTDAAPLNTNAATDTRGDGDPCVTTDGVGNWVAVWHSYENLGGTIGTDGDILVARSTDNGAAWTDPAPLNANAASDVGDDQRPQVTNDGQGNWLAVWDSTSDLSGTIGTDLDILVARSTDSGATWTAPIALNSNAPTDLGSDSRPHVLTDGAGNWVAVWRYWVGIPPEDEAYILVARSTDNGTTWTDSAVLSANAATIWGNVDRSPKVATDAAGNWVAVWQCREDPGGIIGTDSDILVARSTDNGATWSEPTALNTNASTDSGIDWDPQVATDGAGNWLAVWSSEEDLDGTIGTDEDILVARSTDNGVTWTAPAVLNGNAAVDSIWVGDDSHPQMATDGTGHWLAVWGSGDDLGGTIMSGLDILVSHSIDGGANWSAPTPLNSNAFRYEGHDYQPHVATDGAGNWVTVWTSKHHLDGTIGTDADILYATCPPSDAECDGTPDALTTALPYPIRIRATATSTASAMSATTAPTTTTLPRRTSTMMALATPVRTTTETAFSMPTTTVRASRTRARRTRMVTTGVMPATTAR